MTVFCRYCGKQVPEDSVFCQYCGKQLGDSQTETDSLKETNSPKGWERVTMIIHFRKGEGGWVAQESYPAPVAQQYFWNNNASVIYELATMMTDNGWQPVGEHGPSCVELKSYKSAEGNNPLAEVFGAVATYGTSLLFAKNWKFTVNSIMLKWRRPMLEEGTLEEEFHMWFDIKTRELERCELDNVTNQWYPMDFDEDGNWHRRKQPENEHQDSSHSPSPSANLYPVIQSDEDIHPLSKSSVEDEKPLDESSVPSFYVTEDERIILRLIQKGLSNPEIAKRLSRSPVETSLMTTDLLNRFDAKTKDELVRITKEKGFFPPD